MTTQTAGLKDKVQEKVQQEPVRGLMDINRPISAAGWVLEMSDEAGRFLSAAVLANLDQNQE